MLTKKDYKRIAATNCRNGWGFSYKQLMRLIYDHEHGDAHRREYIEERLTDANFHSECAMLMDGEYEKCRANVREDFRGCVKC